MTEILYSYIYLFMHPFKSQDYLRKLRTPQGVTRGEMDDVGSDFGGGVTFTELSIPEAISVSWIFYIIKSFYFLMTILLSVAVYYYFSATVDMGIVATFTFKWQKFAIIFILFDVVLFPVTLWFYSELWRYTVLVAGKLFQVKGDVNQMAKQIIASSMSTHTYLVVPIFGGVVQFFMFFFHLFAGLHKNMEMTKLQAAVVLISPIFVFSGLIFLYYLWIILMILGF
jgi:hypothetical protein